MNELASITTEELGLLLEELHEPKFRTSQVMKWLAKGVPPKEMLNIPKTLREKLSAFPFGGVGIIECKQSKKDDTAKMLYETEDGNVVEGVLMRYSYGNTLCISTQAGCRMGCAFCASTLNGKVRDLTDQARIRVQISAGHDREHLDKCIAAFIKVGKELGVLK